MLNPGRATRSLILLAGLLLIAYSFSACRARGSGQEKRYDLKGKLISIDEKGRQLIIAHEPVEGFMEAMTMPFNVKEGWPFKDMQPGDTIQATLVVDGDRTWLEDIIWSRETSDPAADAASSTDPKPGDEVPDFALLNQDGKRIKLYDYRGRALVLTFIYTRCPLPDYCPLMSESFATIEKSLVRDPALYAKTRLLSISVDPEYDTPNVMRDYGAGYIDKNGQGGFAHWEFATGSKDEIKNIATYFGLAYWDEADQIIHNLRTAIISPDGKLFKLYQGNRWKPEEVLSDLQNFKSVDEPQSRKEADEKKGEQPQDKTYQARGVVESVDKENAMVQIDHEDIKGLMPAMNMPFRVKDKAMLDSIAAGDRIDFTVQDTKDGIFVVAIKKR